MYIAKVTTLGLILSEDTGKVLSEDKTEEVEVLFKSDNRSFMRNLGLLCEENGYPCETTVEVAPRAVTFKGLLPVLAAAAKVDAKADMKTADKDK